MDSFEFTGVVCNENRQWRVFPCPSVYSVGCSCPFDVNRRMDAIRGIRPLKLFEYLAAGIPVIAARWPEIEALQSPAWFYDNTEQFTHLAARALNKRDFDPAAARGFAARFDWKHAFKQMMEALYLS